MKRVAIPNAMKLVSLISLSLLFLVKHAHAGGITDSFGYEAQLNPTVEPRIFSTISPVRLRLL